jgi:ABC-type sugar transport system permease subunit
MGLWNRVCSISPNLTERVNAMTERALKRKTTVIGRDNIGYLLIAPFYIFMIIFIVIPILINFGLSFTSYDLRELKFIGIENYRYLLRDQVFMTSLKNTFIYTVFTLFFAMGIALLAAMMLNKKLLGLKFYRTCIYLPHVTSMVAVAMIWLWIYDPSYGILNQLLGFLGIRGKDWLYDVNLSFGCIIVMSIWKIIGYNMIIYLAGLQNIPSYLYEAATIDGANSVQKFHKITLPMLSPVTFFLFVTGFINNFKVFEQVQILTGGGPMNSTTTIVHQIYNRGFIDFRMGYAAAMSIVLLLVIATITLTNFKYGNQGQDLDIG